MRRKRPSSLFSSIPRLPNIFCNFNSLFITIVFIVSIFLQNIQILSASSIYEDYEECRDHENFGNVSIICDPDHKLQRSTLRSLDNLLRDLQEKISCECSNQCERGEGLSNKYIGLLIVTTSEKIETSTDVENTTDSSDKSKALGNTAKQIYEDAKLGNANCDNGLLIIYIKDHQQLATYRGEKRFTLLNDDDMKRLYELAHAQTKSDDGAALQYLLANYDDKHGAEGILRAETWTPVVGLMVALIIVIVILAVLISIVLAKICCCCTKSLEQKDKYYVNQIPSYKTIEPIYIVTPTLSQHDMPIVHHPQDRHLSFIRHSPISDYSYYNSPYGTACTPIPPPLPPGPSSIYSHRNSTGPIITHPPRSRSVTPTSLHRTKVQSSSTHGSQIIRSPDQTPLANKRDQINRTSTIISKHSNGTYYTTASYAGGPSYSSPDSPRENAPPSTTLRKHSRHHQPMELIPAGNSSASETEEVHSFSFLDPHRKREVQTKKEFIS